MRRRSSLATVITAVVCLGMQDKPVQGQLDTTQISDQVSGESTLSLTKVRPPSVQVLHVLECEGPQEWQLVGADEAVVAWMGNLTDRLTISQDRPQGEDLTIPSWWVHSKAQPAIEPLKDTEFMDPDGLISFHNIVQAQLMVDAHAVWLPKYLLVLFQLTMLKGGPSVQDLHVTASKSFWQTVEATAASGRLVYKASLNAEEQLLPSIEGYAIILPTMLSVMYGQGEWPEKSVSARYGDHSAWDRPEILEMLQHFFGITQSFSLPDLQEYDWRSDKIAQYDLFQQYHIQDPQARTPPIPTVPVKPAVSTRLLRHICYQQRYVKQDAYTVAEEDVRATATAILEAAKELDSNPSAQAIWAHDPDIAGSPVRKYIIKRNHAGFARKVIKLTLGLANWQTTPSLASLLDQPCSQSQPAHDHAGKQTCQSGSSGQSLSSQLPEDALQLRNAATGTAGNAATGPPPILNEVEFLQPGNRAPSELDQANFQNAQQMQGNARHQQQLHGSATDQQQQQQPPQGSAGDQHPCRGSARHQQQAGKQDILGSGVRGVDVLQDAQQLLKAAERMLAESCGEAWLLQPFIADMGNNEYRINMIGGGEAQGTATDTAAVYTPGEAAQNQMHLYNLTLPHGFFSRAVTGTGNLLASFNVSRLTRPYNITKEEYEISYFPFPVYKDPEMHRKLANIALGGARAFQESDRADRMSQHVLLRIDVALTTHNDEIKAFINEAHYYADATIMFPVWPPEAKQKYTCDQASSKASAQHSQSEGQSCPNNSKPVGDQSVISFEHAVRCPEGIAESPQQEVTGWGIWMAEKLWAELQWQHKQAHTTSADAPVLLV